MSESIYKNNELESSTYLLEFIFKPYQTVSLSFLFYEFLVMIWPKIYHFYHNVFVYNAYVLINSIIKMSIANKQHQSSTVILMMIQHIPFKQFLLCHVIVDSNLYFSYPSILFHCIDAVMTRVVYMPFRLNNSFDCHGFSYLLFVIEIIQLLLSALLWCMQIHVQNGSKQWAQ